MYQGLIQEVVGSFASEGPCSFLVEGRCGSFFAPAVAPGMHYLSTLAGHVPGSQVAIVVGAVLVVLTAPSTVLVAFGPETIAQTDIGGFFAPSASVELKFGPCHQ